MKKASNELKLLLQELKDPHKQLNIVFLLISVIPVLSCIYILLGGSSEPGTFRSELVPVLFFSNMILVLGYWAGYRVIQEILRKIRDYSIRARHSEKLRAEMAVALAHDLKGPLAVIKANMANLKEGILGPLSPQQEEMASLCVGVTDRTALLLTDLINSYVPNTETSGSNVARLDLLELVKEQIREVTVVAQTKSIGLKVISLRARLPVDADRSMMLRAINNLLNNAVKYTPSRGKIIVKVSKTEDLARLEVLSTGKPIPEDQLENIFGSCERLDRTAEGQGLGLAIARAIVESHQGKIWADSGPGKTNCFTVLLPLAKN